MTVALRGSLLMATAATATVAAWLLITALFVLPRHDPDHVLMWTVVAAGSVVSSSVPAATMVQGNPAKVVAKCPVPISRGMLFEDFLKLLEPV